MKLLSKISQAIAALVLIAGVSFSTAYARTAKQVKPAKEVVNKIQTYSICGKVVDAQGQPAGDAHIYITVVNVSKMMNTPGSDTVVTNNNGLFKVKETSSGKYILKVKAGGYETTEKQVAATNNKRLTTMLEPLE